MVTPKKKQTATKKKSPTPKIPKAKKAPVEKKPRKKRVPSEKSTIKLQPTRLRIYEDPAMNDLPKIIDRDIVKILQKNPKEVFIFWEISNSTLEKALFSLNTISDNSYIKLCVGFKNAKTHNYQISLPPFTNNWYMKFDFPVKNLVVEVCVVGPDGRYISILKSAILNLPANSPSTEIDLDWVHQKWISEGWIKNIEGLWKFSENFKEEKENRAFLGSSFGSSKHGQ
ncbi:MAG: DUF4912 domain-containing protein [Leptospiraceae bacterium]|nr:DUF4912 domain-containing protein [Leptospiraceae bacterium]MCK6381214.1 DUF4912 domain-containing protein [Leptospiraceae bacterium]NUM42562.1 DUF4912 domain-containing protein [Leptospiraceae bacterium]